MNAAALHPLADLPIDPIIAAMPKADLHLHAEAGPRVERLVARCEGRPHHDWRGWLSRTMTETPAGMPRLNGMNPPPGYDGDVDATPEVFIARVADILEEGAAGGALLVEVRFGRAQVLMPNFMPLFREAERRVQSRYPHLRAEAIGVLVPAAGIEAIGEKLDACVAAAQEGLAGLDIIPSPYDTESDWTAAKRWTRRAAEAGLGLTIHAGEFSTANLAAALRLPGVRRIGHAVHAVRDPRLLDALAESGATVECCLTSNVILGAVASYEEHPIRRLVERGIPITLSTDNPLRCCTSITREYAIAAALGFGPGELLSFTRNGVAASFASPERRTALLGEVDAWGRAMLPPAGGKEAIRD